MQLWPVGAGRQALRVDALLHNSEAHADVAVTDLCQPTGAREVRILVRLVASKETGAVVRVITVFVWACRGEILSQLDVKVRDVLRMGVDAPRTSGAGLRKSFHFLV